MCVCETHAWYAYAIPDAEEPSESGIQRTIYDPRAFHVPTHSYGSKTGGLWPKEQGPGCINIRALEYPFELPLSGRSSPSAARGSPSP